MTPPPPGARPDPAQPATPAGWVWTYLGLAYLALAVYAAVGGHLSSLPDELRRSAYLAADILRLTVGLPVFRP